VNRCAWCTTDPAYQAYHDDEWAVPTHDDHRHFEMLILEGAQAGLNWLTILKKREGYRQAFDGFDAQKIARYDRRQIQRLLDDTRIVRNRLKVESAVRNAQAFLDVQSEFGSFDALLWRFVDSTPKQNAWTSLSQIPARTEESDAMSKELTRRGFNFIGSTICYAFMQAVGMVNDHVTDCFRYEEVARLARPAP
jgi:DNA-3-methyladenine glycosylase I